jgi:glycosyltransferase involved in cell wall biosynthesis
VKVALLVYNSFQHDARVLRHAVALADHGWDVRVIATMGSDGPRAERLGAVRVSRLDCDPLPAKLARAAIAARRGRGAASSGASVGTVIGAVDLDRRAGALRALAVRAALSLHLTLTWLRFHRKAMRALRAEPADVYIANDLDTLPAAVVARRRLGGRVLYDSHELYTEHVGTPRKTRVARAVQAAVERRLICRADRVITVNESIADELSLRYGASRPAVIMNVPARPTEPRDLEPVDLRRKLGLHPGRRLALYVGGISTGRGMEEMVASARFLDDVDIVLLGPVSASYRRGLEESAAAAGVADRVFFASAVAGNEVMQHAAGADVGLVPYRNTCLNNYLSLPNKLFEYLAAGVPVVASDFPELRRVVRGEEVGATCDPDDPADIARAIAEVIRDPEWHRALSANARRAAERFTWERERPKLLKIMDDLRR